MDKLTELLAEVSWTKCSCCKGSGTDPAEGMLSCPHCDGWRYPGVRTLVERLSKLSTALAVIVRNVAVEGLGLRDPWDPASPETAQDWTGLLSQRVADLRAKLTAAEQERDAHRRALRDIATTVDPAASDGENSVHDILVCIRAGAEAYVKLAASETDARRLREALEAVIASNRTIHNWAAPIMRGGEYDGVFVPITCMEKNWSVLSFHDAALKERDSPAPNAAEKEPR